MKKRPLRSSKDVYDRLKWGREFPLEKVFIGYTDRIEGMKEIPFAEFRPGGRIPWDRLQYFRLGDRRIWDRQDRIDLLFGSGETAEEEKLQPRAGEPALGKGFVQRTAWRFDTEAQRWVTAPPGGNLRPRQLRIVTFNVLRTDYDAGFLDNELRIPALLDRLARERADLVVLQEVQAEFFQALLRSTWVRRYFHISEPPGTDALQPHGVLLLSRFPPAELLDFPLDRQRKAVVGRFDIRGRTLNVAVLHLPSDRNPDAPRMREAFLDRLTTALPPDETHVLAGDMNFGDEQRVPALHAYTDLWTELRPGLPGHTYDPVRNPLAKRFSLKGRPRRLDRIFLRSPDGTLHPHGIGLIGTEPLRGGVMLSDHFGLAATLLCDTSYRALQSTAPVHRSALCIIPPENEWREIQAIRKLHDPQMERWMPHINLLYGFIPEALFSAAVPAIRNALADIPPFTVTLAGFDVFHHKGSATVYSWPDAESTGHLRALQDRLRELFPNCSEQDRFGEFRPHLTVGKFRGTEREALPAYLRSWEEHWAPLRFEVRAVSLISRRGREPFFQREAVPLSRAGLPAAPPHTPATALGKRGLLPGSAAEADAQRILKIVRKAHANCGKGGAVTPIGSYALGTGLTGGDLDLVATGGGERNAWFRDMHDMLRKFDRVENARIVKDTLVPVLKARILGRPVDILYGEFDAEDAGTVAAYAGIREAAAIREMAAAEPEAFRTTVRCLKAWAQVMEVHGNAFGYPGGLGWTVLALAAGPASTPDAWLERFFVRFADYDWSRPVALTHSAGAGATHRFDNNGPTAFSPRMFVHSLSFPQTNITRNVTTSNLRALRDALLSGLGRIWEIRAGRMTWDDFFNPPEFHFPKIIDAGLTASGPVALEKCKGWIRRHWLTLLLALEQGDAPPVRPLTAFRPEGPGAGNYMIGLEEMPDEAGAQAIESALADFEAKFEGWKGRPEGARLSFRLRAPETY